MKKVAIIQTRLTAYREGFFEDLKEFCSKRNISLTLYCGVSSKTEKLRQDEGSLSWVTTIKSFSFRLFGVDLVWQALPWKSMSSFDLIIMQQENRILSNYRLFLIKGQKTKLAFWGHGKNFQSNHPTGLRERFKEVVSLKVDWWFAYTQVTQKLLQERGFPSDRIVLVNNSTKTSYLKSLGAHKEAIEVERTKRILGFQPDERIGLFCGNLATEKKIQFLIEACQQVKQEFKNFSLVIMGSGPLAPFVERQSKLHRWIRWVGRIHGQEKIQFFAVSDFLMGPGMVGLNIIDGFAAGLPLITTESHNHSPEIAYLENGLNGLMTPENVNDFVAGILSLLQDPVRLQNMSKEAFQTSQNYSLENMVKNFGGGILGALA